jgi:protein phosphatase
MKKTIAVHWQYGISTHSGWYRDKNEDRTLLRIGSSEQGDPYAVAIMADGMGGLGSGAEASEIALSMIKQWMDQTLPSVFAQDQFWDQLDRLLGHLFDEINRRLRSIGQERGGKIGTTLTVLVLYKESYLIHHVGDCRVYYLKRGSRLRLLTEDHSWVSEQVRQGRLSASAAAKHPMRNVLMQCLGVQNQVVALRKRGFYDPFSLFMLCSDGLYHRFRRDQLERLMLRIDRTQTELQEVCAELIAKALDQGADDNMTVLMIRPMKAYSSDKERLKRELTRLYRDSLPETGRKICTYAKYWLNRFVK